MAVTTTTSTTPKRSWASIVKGQDDSPPPSAPSETTDVPSSGFDYNDTIDADAPLFSHRSSEAETAIQPGKRGERTVLCWGEVLVMLGHYGWIMPFDDIDAPAAKDKTAGRVYLNTKRDLAKGTSLVQGDYVSFYLYADDQGLGAECCKLEKSYWQGKQEKEGQKPVVATSFADAAEFVPGVAPTRPLGQLELASVAMNFRTDADVFVPGVAATRPLGQLELASWNLGASEFVPTSDSAIVSSFCKDVPEFVPAKMHQPFDVPRLPELPQLPTCTMKHDAKEFVPATMNVAAQVFVPTPFVAPKMNMFAFNSAFFSDSEDESDDEDSVASNGNAADKESNDGGKESSDDEFEQDKNTECPSSPEAVMLCASIKLSSGDASDGSTDSGAESDASVHSALAKKLNFSPSLRAPPGLALPVQLVA